MAEQLGKFLTELPELTSPSDSNLMYVVDGDTSKKATLGNFKKIVGGDVTGAGSGAIVSFSDGADNIPLKSFIAQINPTQDLHGYSKPWAGGAGKNKYIGSPSFSGYERDTYWTLDSDTYHGHEVYKRNAGWWGLYKEVYLPVGTYTFSVMCKSSDSIMAYIFLSLSDVSTAVVNIDNTTAQTSTSWSKISFTFNVITAGTVCARIERGDANGYIYISEYSIEEGNSATTYEPYANICPISGSTSVTVTVSDGETSTTKTTPLGQTVYGGQLNVLTGELVIDRQIVDLGSLTWTRTDNSIIDVGYWFHANVSGKIATGETINSNYRTAPYKSVTQLVNAEGSAVDKVAVEAGGEVGYRIIDSSYTDATAFKTAMNGVQMCYFLATPITVQLTPQEVNSLLGQNYIEADSGDVDLVYVRNLNIVINDLINRVTALENE